jgi:hypothetical protein
VLSGDTHAFEDGEMPAAVAFLKKPIEIDRLVEEVRKCFAAKDSTLNRIGIPGDSIT